MTEIKLTTAELDALKTLVEYGALSIHYTQKRLRQAFNRLTRLGYAKRTGGQPYNHYQRTHDGRKALAAIRYGIRDAEYLEPLKTADSGV